MISRTAIAVAVVTALAAPATAGVLDCPPAEAGDGKKDKKTRAGEHYRRGQELYAAGEYDDAIPEFRAAYCLVPAAEAVYNVAQSYERLVDYTQAVAWFEAYLDILGKGKREEALAVENRLKVLRRLPARIRVSTDPPGARIRIDGPAGTVEGVAGGEPLRVQAGRYTMLLELPGFVPVTETVVAEIGQPYTYSYRLSPQTGTLRVSARPSEARILLDDRVVGTGVYVDRVPVGEHTITVEAPLRPPERRKVTVSTEREERLHVDMQPARPRNGKIELLIASSALGLVEAGLMVSSLTEDRPTIGVLSVAGGAAGFFLPLLVLPRQVPTGQTSLMIGGRFWGAMEGLGIASIVAPNLFDEDRVLSSFLVAGGSIVGGVTAALIAPRFDVSAGEAALINSGGMWGAASAAFLIASLDGEDDAVATTALLGGVNLGLITGILLATQYEPSRGRVFLIDLSGAAGIISGTALSALLQRTDDAEKFAFGGMAVGLVVGTLVTASVDDDSDVMPFASTTREGTPLFGLGGRW
jgi:hypothetical protein